MTQGTNQQAFLLPIPPTVTVTTPSYPASFRLYGTDTPLLVVDSHHHRSAHLFKAADPAIPRRTPQGIHHLDERLVAPVVLGKVHQSRRRGLVQLSIPAPLLSIIKKKTIEEDKKHEKERGRHETQNTPRELPNKISS